MVEVVEEYLDPDACWTDGMKCLLSNVVVDNKKVYRDSYYHSAYYFNVNELHEYWIILLYIYLLLCFHLSYRVCRQIQVL